MRSLFTKIVLITLAIVLGSVGLYRYKIARDASDINNQLFAAVRTNDIEKAKQLIERGADVNAEKVFKTTVSVLVEAIREGEPEMVALLLRNGATVEKKHTYEWSPLTYAISIAFGRYELMMAHPRVPWKTVRLNQRYIIPLLVAKGAQSDYHQIFSALLSDDMDAIQKLTPEVKDEVKRGTLSTDELLQAAIYSRNKQIIDYVINTIMGKDVVGKTGKLLQWAIESDDQDTINYMLTYPLTDINAQEQPYGYSSLHAAVIYPINGKADVELVKKLVEMGANPNLTDAQGNTPLHIALGWRKNNPIAELLIAHGADLRIKNDAGNSAEDLLKKESNSNKP
jgi:hypothetical protein